MNLQKVDLNKAKEMLDQWQRDGRFEPFENQRYWLRGWERYAATEDLSAIPLNIPYLYFVGDQDSLVLAQGVEAEYGSAVYEGVPMAKPSAHFLEVLKLRGIPPVIWPNLRHAYAGPNPLPANAPQDVLEQTISRILQVIPSASAAGVEEDLSIGYFQTSRAAIEFLRKYYGIPEGEHLVQLSEHVFFSPFVTPAELLLTAVERAAPLMQGKEVLEIGTAHGHAVSAAVVLSGAARGVGIDIDQEAVALGREYLSKLGLTDRVELLAGDMFAPVAGRQFDWVISNTASIEMAERFIASVGSFLRPEGVALLQPWDNTIRGEAAFASADLYPERFVKAARRAGLVLQPVLKGPGTVKVYALARRVERLEEVRKLFAEGGDYERQQTDPRNHNDQDFTYFVHMTDELAAGLFGAEGIFPSMLKEPHRQELISTSIVHRDPENQVLDTYRNQRIGYILRVPRGNIAWVAPFDFFSDRNRQSLRAILGERGERGLLPFNELIESSQRYQTANEALVFGTGVDGRKVETVGVMVLQDPSGTDESEKSGLVSKARELGLSIVKIRPKQRTNRFLVPSGSEQFIKQLGLPAHPTPEQLELAQAQFEAWQNRQSEALALERESYIPRVLRSQPAAGVEEIGWPGVPSGEASAGLQEPSKWDRTDEEIAQALQEHPGGEFVLDWLVQRTGKSLGTLRNHNWRSLVEKENIRRVVVELKLIEPEERNTDAEGSIDKALREHPGGYLTMEQLADLASVGIASLVKYDWRARVDQQNLVRSANTPQGKPILLLVLGQKLSSIDRSEKPPWEPHTGRLRGLEDFPLELQGALSKASGFAQRVLVLAEFLRWDDATLGLRAGMSKRPNAWRNLQIETPLPEAVRAFSAAVNADPVFLLTGQSELSALQSRFPAQRLELLATAQGLTQEELASQAGISQSAVYLLFSRAGTLDRQSLFTFSYILEREPATIETGFPIPKKELLFDPAGETGFSRTMFVGVSKPKYGPRAEALQDAIVQAWREANRQGENYPVEVWESEIAPDPDYGYPGLAARLMSANAGTLEQGVYYGLITPGVADKLRQRQELNLEEVSELAASLAAAYLELTELLEAVPSLKPPKGYPNTQSAKQRIRHPWDLIARFMTQERMLLILNKIPSAHNILKTSILDSSNPEGRLKKKESAIAHLSREFPGLSRRLISRYVWMYANPEEMLPKAVELHTRLENWGKRGWIRSRHWKDDRIESPEAFASRIVGNSVISAERVLAQAGVRDAVLRSSLEQAPFEPLREAALRIPGLQTDLEARDLVNRVAGWRQALDPGFFSDAPNPEGSAANILFAYANPFLTSVQAALADLQREFPRDPNELDAFARRIAEKTMTGLEESAAATMVRLAQAVPIRSMLAIQASVLETRGGLEELLEAIPQEGNLSWVILQGNDPSDWTATLMSQEADSVVFVGDLSLGAAVGQMLPESMTITVLDPGAALQRIFLALGIQPEMVSTIDWVGLEEQRQPLQSA
ncbi:MAG: methyltransferase domain-containing protein [Candidatus Omnitrophota bacterium]|nr:methyltransferase domain-containing protein [Candidatus Omnitrophota bacterium]